MNGYTKLFGSILASTIWREKDHVRLVWITMLAMADQDGMVEASVPGLADFARVTEEQCDDAILRLSSPDKRSRSKDFEGRRIAERDGGWRLLNYEKYRDRMSADDQRQKAAQRQQRKRARDAASREASRSVTNGHEMSPSITPPSASASASESETGSGEQDPGRETVCPLDLVARLEANGTLAALAEKLAAPLVSVRHEAEQFVAYWAIGKGMGQRRTAWVGKCRQWIVEKHGKGELRPPGAIQHEEPQKTPPPRLKVPALREFPSERREPMLSAVDAEELQRRVDAALRGTQ